MIKDNAVHLCSIAISDPCFGHIEQHYLWNMLCKPLSSAKRGASFPASMLEQNASSSWGTQNFVSALGGRAPSSSYHHGVSHSGLKDERLEVGKSFPRDGNFSVGRQNWDMKFKDAFCAAQAVAESAERASLAARAVENWNMKFKDATCAAQAAVEFAEHAILAARAVVQLSRVTRQFSSDSQGHIPSEAVNKNSHDSASVALDDSSSEDNGREK
ncbi:hypothetical protein A4A49_30484 [Nicotiana attenuata]|uniref:Uncharacterized protein n=1 Tax=Nicotiana attenuata TaxID=49451 RepID=A0A1J6JLF1_NICAT|nr:hypothetical protein A4A49_30484 [Nicotiana attenuata]